MRTKHKRPEEIVQMMKDGWKLEEARNYNGRSIKHYYLCKRNEKEEHFVSTKTRDKLIEDGFVTTNNELPRPT